MNTLKTAFLLVRARCLATIVTMLFWQGGFFTAATPAAHLSIYKDDLPTKPKVPHAFTALPIGQVRPEGWLLDWAKDARTGLIGHPLVEGFEPDDFKFWFDAKLDRPSPLFNVGAFRAPGWERILLSSDLLVAGQKPDGKGYWSVCQLALSGRITGNPVASVFVRRLLTK